MVVPQEILKCVAFVGARKTDGTYVYCGSAFFFGLDGGRGACVRVFAVTAKHVIDGIRGLGCTEVWLRFNLANGATEWRCSQLAGWFSHPTDKSLDAVIHEWGVPAELDHRVIPHTIILTDDIAREFEVGLGEEILITGLFSLMKETERNVPIIRIGNLSCLSGERIPTNSVFGKIHGMLAEVRSIGGLSGSPVFVNLGRARVVRNELTVIRDRPTIYIIGLVHGHFQTAVDVGTATSGDVTLEKMNAGIAIIVPINQVFDLMSEFMRELAKRIT